MGQILHGSATTTHAVRAAIQRSKATAKELAGRHRLDPKTVAKWKKRDFVEDAPMGPKAPRSTVLTPEEEAVAVAFRKLTLLPLDDCLYALQATIPHLTRSSLHRLFQRCDFSGSCKFKFTWIKSRSVFVDHAFAITHNQIFLFQSQGEI